jgi:hypothetical protein
VEKWAKKKQLKTKSRLKQVYHEKFDGIMQYHVVCCSFLASVAYFFTLLPFTTD